MNTLFMILSLVGGLALFLYGMDLMGDSLKKLAGGKLESILAKLTSNPLKGFLLGFAVTSVIQSSSATTVMLVGFVNSGIMNLGQTISIIFGANIGTTVTAWLLSTADIQGTAAIIKLFKPESFTPVLAVVGLLMIMMEKSDKKKNLGTIFIGFAILMFGMDAMSGAVEPLRDNETFKNFLVSFSNPFIGIVVGAVFTAILQSSSASVGILQALSMSCAVPFSTAIPVIMGQNIGTTITPIISSVSGNTDSKRVALCCLYIKVAGSVAVGGIFYALNAIFPFAFMEGDAGPVQIALVHTLFNVFTTILLLPLHKLFEKLAVLSVKAKKGEERDVFAALDDRFLEMPGFAVEMCKELVCEMINLAITGYRKAVGLLDHFDPEVFREVVELEAMVDKYEDKTSTYLVKLSKGHMSSEESKTVTELLHCIGDIERISDHALNIAEAAKEVADKKLSFSEKAKGDLKVITSAVEEILFMANASLVGEDVVIAKKVEPLEQVIDDLKRKIKNGHILRLRDGDCTMEMGFILSDLLTNFERISDHCSNIAVCFIEMANGSFRTHEYLNAVKSGGEKEFGELFRAYSEKYHIL